MVNRKVVEEWLDKADEDFRFASTNLEEKNSFHTQICFYFQQAAEKYLKTYIIAFELESKKTHDLIQLINLCNTNDTSFKVLREYCEYLNGFYIETRYPVHWPTHYTKETAQKAQGASMYIGDFVEDKLKQSTIGDDA